MTTPLKICAVLTAFNRREQTLRSLRSFFSQAQNVDLSAVLMDDGSEDGTTAAVQNAFQGTVTVLRGNGLLYWSRGMAAAFKEACARGADYYLWLNDDTILYPNALSSLIQDAEVTESLQGRIVVGSTRDPDSGECTYGGLIAASSWHAGKFKRLHPQSKVQACHAMNGNIVLISNTAAKVLGGIDERFSHSMGDYDYGLRAVRAGVAVLVGRGFHGECSRNPAGSYWYESVTLRERYKRVNAPKGLPMKEWAYFLNKHGGVTWPLAWLATYRRILTR